MRDYDSWLQEPYDYENEDEDRLDYEEWYERECEKANDVIADRKENPCEW